jgi:SAM-dependent methyltransferase
MSSPPTKADNAAAWGLPRVLEYFDDHRSRSDDVYPSEWHFLEEQLHDGMSVLDVGCAQGGFANIIGERISGLHYTGIDISAEMVHRARDKFPQHNFHQVSEGSFGIDDNEQFDLVLVLGILHLHEDWRQTISGAWHHTRKSLILDLRETDGDTIEDKSRSAFRMNFNGGDDEYAQRWLPYNILNSDTAGKIVAELCVDASRIRDFGYPHAVSEAADTPFQTVTTRTYCIEQ